MSIGSSSNPYSSGASQARNSTTLVAQVPQPSSAPSGGNVAPLLPARPYVRAVPGRYRTP
jgi:hypothetical protein